MQAANSLGLNISFSHGPILAIFERMFIFILLFYHYFKFYHSCCIPFIFLVTKDAKILTIHGRYLAFFGPDMEPSFGTQP